MHRAYYDNYVRFKESEAAHQQSINNMIRKSILITVLVAFFFLLIGCQDSKAEYQIVFETNGGTPIESVTITSLDELNLNVRPSKVGYDFVAWFLDDSFTSSVDNLVLDQTLIVLYAKWEIKTYDVIINYNNENDPLTLHIEHGSILPRPDDPVYGGMVFENWYSDSQFTSLYDFSSVVSKNTSIYAKWVIYVPTDAEKLEMDLAALSLPSQTQTNLTFPSRGSKYDSRLSWTSSHQQFVTNNGFVTLPGFGTNGKTVTITVTATLNQSSATRTFEIFIPQKAESVVTGLKNIPFVNVSTEYTPSNGNIDVFFVDNTRVPYVDIYDFIVLLDGAIESVIGDPMDYTDDDGINYQVIKYMEVEAKTSTVILVRLVAEYYLDQVLTTVDTYEAEFDFVNNTYYSDSFTFFEVLGASTSTDFGEGLTFGESFETIGSDILISFNDYRFDLVQYTYASKVKNLIPLHIANLIFVGSVYYDAYYNGDAIYGVDSYQFLDSDAAVITAKTSSMNTQSATTAEKIATYDYLALVFNHFYGLKKDRNIEDYYNVFGSLSYPIMYGNDDQHYRAIFEFVYKIDDLHTYHIESGFYFDPYQGYNISINDLGQRSSSYYESKWALDDYVKAVYGRTGRPVLRIIDEGKTAIIAIDSFTVDTPHLFKQQLDKIQLDYPTVQNVVVDLTLNGGGNVGAVWRTLGYMTDDVILYHSQNPIDGATFTYEIYDQYTTYPFEWFILISPTTFSAANLMAAQAKELGIATVIGVKSSGGASSISGTVLPTGDVIFMSSSNVISTKNSQGEYISIENGVEPMINFGSLDKLVDEAYIASVINQFLTNQS